MKFDFLLFSNLVHHCFYILQAMNHLKPEHAKVVVLIEVMIFFQVVNTVSQEIQLNWPVAHL